MRSARSTGRVTMLSIDDIFTFNALTTRERDRHDMNRIHLEVIDMDVVHGEV